MNQSQKIRNMALKGSSNSVISKKLGIRYQTVWRTLNRPYKGIIPQKELIEKGIRTIEEPLLQEVTE